MRLKTAQELNFINQLDSDFLYDIVINNNELDTDEKLQEKVYCIILAWIGKLNNHIGKNIKVNFQRIAHNNKICKQEKLAFDKQL